MSPGLFVLGEPFNQLPSTDLTTVKCQRLSKQQNFNNYYNNFGSASHQITWWNSSNVNVGRDHPLIHNQKMYCWRGTTLLLYTGPWLSSQMSIQDLMESYEWSLSKLQRELSEVGRKNLPSITCQYWTLISLCSGKGQILCTIKLLVATMGHMLLMHHMHPSRIFLCSTTRASQSNSNQRKSVTCSGISCTRQQFLFSSHKG